MFCCGVPLYGAMFTLTIYNSFLLHFPPVPLQNLLVNKKLSKSSASLYPYSNFILFFSFTHPLSLRAPILLLLRCYAATQPHSLFLSLSTFCHAIFMVRLTMTRIKSSFRFFDYAFFFFSSFSVIWLLATQRWLLT
jgi:hypothetical protein